MELIDRSVCLSVYPSVYLSISPSIYPSVHPSISPSIYTSLCTSLCFLFTWPSTHDLATDLWPILVPAFIFAMFGPLCRCFQVTSVWFPAIQYDHYICICSACVHRQQDKCDIHKKRHKKGLKRTTDDSRTTMYFVRLSFSM